MMKTAKKNESKTIAMILFVLTLIPGAILMGHSMDSSAVVECLSDRAMDGISTLFLCEIAGILAYIGVSGWKAFRKCEHDRHESRGERVTDEIISAFVLVLFVSLAVLLLYNGITEPFFW